VRDGQEEQTNKQTKNTPQHNNRSKRIALINQNIAPSKKEEAQTKASEGVANEDGEVGAKGEGAEIGAKHLKPNKKKGRERQHVMRTGEGTSSPSKRRTMMVVFRVGPPRGRMSLMDGGA
jgi:hypothetical protein